MDEYKTDKSYGMIQACKISGGDGKFFGSDVSAYSYIEITLRQGSIKRELGHDWYSAEKDLITVKLTPIQWAEFLTTMNVGYGVPCTVTRVGCEHVPFKDVEKTKIETMEEEIDAESEKLVDVLSSARSIVMELLASNKISKTVGKDLLFKIEGPLSKLREGNKSFYAERRKEEVAKMVTAAKAEVEAFITHKVYSTGIQALKGELPKLDT